LQKLAEKSAESSLNAEARAYLTQVMERWQTMAKELGISISGSVTFGSDVASALLSQAQPGEQGQATEGSRGSDLIVISTYGRHGLERWEAVWGTETMGSVTERVLNSTKLPVLIVRPQVVSKAEERQTS
jgi:nucleotide-binding universal stress UspA family protein